MFISETNVVAVEALRATFDSAYPVAQFRPHEVAGSVQPLWISVEAPMARSHYPGIWVEFETTGDLQTAGIDHKEVVVDDGGRERLVRRWRFTGRLLLTCAALSSVERDLLADEVIKLLASGMEHPARSRFRQAIEGNDLVGLQANWDKTSMTSPVGAPGTPWGTDDWVYERTLVKEVQGEFVSDLTQDQSVLVPLSAVRIYERAQGEPWPTPVAGQDGWV